jgi:hypothetical protein
MESRGDGMTGALLDRGTLVAGYRIDAILGRGGMGVVYEATQLSLNRKVALKLLTPQLGADPAFRERFRREGLIQAAIDHPHIVTVYEAGETDEGLFLAMRIVRGPTLKAMIVARELDAERALRILAPTADALDTAHRAGLIHRDVKPQNILVGARDHPYLADFGLTKAPGDWTLTKAGQLLGTIDYICPEQLRGQQVTSRSDVYSLAAVLYECLTGVIPFPRDTEAAVLYAHIAELPPRVTDQRPELPASLDELIAIGMAKEPGDRYESPSQLLEEAQRAFSGRAHGVIGPPGPILAAEEAGIRGPGAAEATTMAGSAPLAPRRNGGSGVTMTLAAPARRRAVLAAVSIALVAAAGAAGFATGRSGSKTHAAAPGPAVSNRALSLSLPPGWHPRKANARAVPGLVFRRPVAAATSGATLLAGNVSATGPALLPTGLLRRLGGPPSRQDTVRLGRLEAYRYAGLEPRGFRRLLNLYVVPDSRGVATIACYAPTEARLAGCGGAAATLELRHTRAYRLGPNEAYARALRDVIGRLNSVRGAARDDLRSALSAGQQAAQAGRLEHAYRAASHDLARAPVSPEAQDANTAIVRGLRHAVGIYSRLAAAARAGDPGAWHSATRAAVAQDGVIQRKFEGLKPLGYRVR